MATYEDLVYKPPATVGGQKEVWTKDLSRGFKDPTELAGYLGVDAKTLNWGAIKDYQAPTVTSVNPTPLAPITKDYSKDIYSIYKTNFGRNPTAAELADQNTALNDRGLTLPALTTWATNHPEAKMYKETQQVTAPVAELGAPLPNPNDTGNTANSSFSTQDLMNSNNQLPTLLAQNDRIKKTYDYVNTLMEQLKAAREASTAAAAITSEETDLNKQLADIRNKADMTNLSAEAGIANVKNEPVAMKFIAGGERNIQEQANLQLKTMAAQEKNLLTRLGLAQEARKIKTDAANQKISNLGTDIDLQFKVSEMLTSQENNLIDQFQKYNNAQKKDAADILDSLKGLDPAKLDPATQAKITQIAAAKGLAPSDILAGLQLQHDQLTLENAKMQNEQANLNRKFEEDKRQFGLEFALKQKQVAIDQQKADQAKMTDVSNLSVDDWVKLIVSGQSKLSEVPNPKGSTLRSDVASALIKNGSILLSDKDREKLSVLDTAFNVADTIKNLSAKINTFDATGRATGYLSREAGARLQTDPILARYEAARKGFVSNVARTLGEKGALAEGDVQRAIENLPTIHDTKDVAEGKLATLFNILEGNKTSIIQKSTEPLNKTTSGTLNQSNQNNDPMGIR